MKSYRTLLAVVFLVGAGAAQVVAGVKRLWR